MFDAEKEELPARDRLEAEDAPDAGRAEAVNGAGDDTDLDMNLLSVRDELTAAGGDGCSETG
jgi:hypothetical protein